MNFGLADKDVSSIQQVLRAFPQVERAIVYGSRAKGNFKAGSDIDIVIKGNNLNFSILAAISSQIDDLPIPYKVDLFIYDRIKNDALIDHINRVGKELL